MDLTDVRADLAALLDTLGEPWTVTAYIPADPDPPCLAVGVPRAIQYRANVAGHQRVELGILIVAGALTDPEVAQAQLDVALGTGAGSVAAVLDGARATSWRGQCRVIDAGDVRSVEVSGTRQVLVADVTIEITG
jgi:hypothetical protein